MKSRPAGGEFQCVSTDRTLTLVRRLVGIAKIPDSIVHNLCVVDRYLMVSCFEGDFQCVF